MLLPFIEVAKWFVASLRLVLLKEVNMTISVCTADYDALLAAIEQSAKEFDAYRSDLSRPHNFYREEPRAYAYCMRKLAQSVVAELRNRFDGKSFSIVFSCDASYWGSARMKVLIADVVEVDIFDIFFDKFTPGLCRGTAYEYADEMLARARTVVWALKSPSSA